MMRTASRAIRQNALVFDDVLSANRTYAESFGLAGLEPRAARGLAVVTCIDSRIEPLPMLGLAPGDAKILRNAGARVTDDVLRSLVLAVNLLGVDRVCVVQHTKCRDDRRIDAELQETLGATYDVDACGWDFLPIDDQHQVAGADVERIRPVRWSRRPRPSPASCTTWTRDCSSRCES